MKGVIFSQALLGRFADASCLVLVMKVLSHKQRLTCLDDMIHSLNGLSDKLVSRFFQVGFGANGFYWLKDAIDI